MLSRALHLEGLDQLYLIKWPATAFHLATAHFRLFNVNHKWNFLLEFNL